jgi:Zn-dependent protease with chaperone function
MIFFFGAPLWILFGSVGGLVGFALSLACLIGLRWNASARIQKRLGAIPWSQAEAPVAFSAIRELCRRLNIQCPQVVRVPSLSINMAVYGFSNDKRFLVITQGAFERLRRDEFAALTSRQLVRLQKDQVTLDTWLCQFLSIPDWIVGKRFARTVFSGNSKGFFLEHLQRLLIYPFCLIPVWLLRDRRDVVKLDQNALALHRHPLALSEALRTLESSAARGGLNIHAGDRHLFLLPPPSRDPFAEFLFPAERLGKRVFLIEGRTQAVTVG